MRTIVLPLLALCAGAALAQQTHQERTIRKQLAHGRPYPAIRVASGMIAKGGHPEFLALRAECYNAIAEHQKAEADARNSVIALPDSTAGLFQLAVAEQGLGKLDSAYAHFTAVIARKPGLEAHYRRALVAQLQGRLGAADQDIALALALDSTGPDAAKLHRVKGEVAAMAGDSLLARTELDRAVALAPDDPVNYNSRGYYGHAFRGDHAGAIAEYDKAIKLNPNYSYAFNNRGWSLYKTGQTAKALKDIQHARKKKPRNPFIYRNLGIISVEGGDTLQGCIYFRQALDLGFTELYGPEVRERIAASCGTAAPEKAKAPVQAPPTTLDRKTDEPVRRVNAP